MKTAKITALALASLLALSSCGGTGGGSDTTSAPEETTPEVTTAEFTPAAVDLGGADFTVLLWADTYLGVEEESGDTIDDAIFRRDRKVEETFNLNFKYDIRECPHNGAGFSEWYGVLSSSILAGDNAYQLAGGYSYQLAARSLQGEFYNLNENANIDFTESWWPSNVMEAGNVGGKLYLTYGNMDPLYYDFSYAIFFNKRLAEEYNVDSLYSTVKSGSWTIDKMIEISKTAATDLNGDTVIGDEDRFGYITDWNMSVDAWIQACDIKITETDSSGMPSLLGLTEKYIDVQKKLDDFFKNSGVAKYGSTGDNVFRNMFMSGQGLFFADKIGHAHVLRDMQDDFGIIPYPKYDEEQESYITYNAIGDTTGFCIPVTANENESGAVLEALAYHGWKEVLPEYFERALKGKAARDTESSEMLELIYASVEFDFTQIYSFSFGDQKSPSMVMRMTMKNNKEISSLWATDEPTYASTMEKLLDSIK